MSQRLPKPNKKAMIYEDNKLYACLASFPITKGHTVVVWKKPVPDLHLLTKKDYEYLMDLVDALRNALLKTLKISKVYLLYMDEVRHVHWHLIPRYNQKGYTLLKHKPQKITNFALAAKIERNLKKL